MIGTLLLASVAATDVPAECGFTKEARQLAALIILDDKQQRPQLRCDAKLTQLAAKKAKEMALSGHVNHWGGGGANSRVIEMGYPLDRRYGIGISNQIEAVAGGYDDAATMWQEFKASEGHRRHLLGEHPSYREQDEIGVGYYYRWESPHITYWAVYVARKEDGSDDQVVLLEKP
ncbi:CAP domain-containing protein [uncultured Ferrimonas sp.]|uniref:CAP domain-containing protein n=1 Tax=uncultured Ferrimonas sp. TaxID=432640 RepID=UPI0026175BFC|nr:CAP domain-containing protein [uncultured Ferrimonas sp.]